MNKYFVPTDSEVEQALKILNKADTISLDTETDGLSAYNNKIWSIQMGTTEDAFLFPYSGLSETSRALLRQFVAQPRLLFLAHYAKFDYEMMAANGFEIHQIYCTKEAEQFLYAGKYFTWGLKDVLKRRFQIQMDKEIRADFYDGTFQQRVNEFGDIGAWTEEHIEYGLEDIVYLHEIYESQLDDVKQLGMSNIEWLERVTLPVVADMELRGVWLDDKAVKKFQSKVVKRRDELRLELFGRLEKSFNISWQREYKRRMALWDDWQRKHNEVKAQNSERDPNDKRRKTEASKKAVEDSNKLKPFFKIPSAINVFSPTSPVKLRMALSELTGMKLTTTNKEWLEENIELHPAIADLVEFRKYEKLVQFCELKEEIDPTTGLVHANFNKTGTKAGRFSCDSPNLQQIPARTDEGKEFRSLFKAQEGEKFVGADLAGIELVILAYYSGETILLDAINGGKDVHCFTMSQFLTATYDTILKAKGEKELTPEEVEELTSARATFEASFAMPELIKKPDLYKWVKTLRDYTKTMTYGAVYGLTPYGLSIKFHCTKDVAGEFLDLLFTAYQNLKGFLKQQEELGFERQYAVNPLGRRRWFSAPRQKTYQEIEKEVIKELDAQKRLWDSVTESEWSGLIAAAIKEAQKEYRGKIGYIKRQAGNFFPQSLCAEMIKLAMYRFDRDFKTGDKKEGLILTIHDELWAKCREENAERCKQVLEDSMEFAVKKFMPEVVTKVEAVISDYWQK